MCSVKLYMSFKDGNQIENQACSFSLVWRCYGRALKLLPECAQLWHDLGFNLYLQSLHADDENALGVAEKSAEALKMGLSLDSANHQIWNTLGLVYCHSGEMFMSEGIDDFKENIPSLKGRISIYMYIHCIHVHVLVNEKRSLAFNFLLPGLNKPSLGQHCFIKSIQTEPEVSSRKIYDFDGNHNLFIYLHLYWIHIFLIWWLNFLICFQNVVAWTNLATLYQNNGNIKVISFCFFCDQICTD